MKDPGRVGRGLESAGEPGRTADASAATARADASAAASESESDASDAEPETFSDVDDDEADYIHTEEVKLRRVIWSELNKDTSRRKPPRRRRRRRRAPAPATRARAAQPSSTRTVPADSAAEAAHAMLSSKKISSKINYDALNDLFKQDSLDAAEREARESEGQADAPDETAGRRGEGRRRMRARRGRAGAGAAVLPPRGVQPHLKAGEKHAPGLAAAGSARGSPRRAPGGGGGGGGEEGRGRRGVVAPRSENLRRRACRRGEEAGYVGRDARRSRDAVHRAARREARQEHERRRLAFLRRRRVTHPPRRSRCNTVQLVVYDSSKL